MTRRPVDLLLFFSLVAPIVVLTLITALRSWRRSAETTEGLGRRIRRGAGGREYFVPGWGRRTDAGWANTGVAGFLAETTALAEAGDIGGALEAEITGTTDHIFDHAAQFLSPLAGILDYYRFAKVTPLCDVPYVSTS